jgi:sterol desaturase/sphingolipid hydroxylase (fatty acid hydroxylase superfamily)
MNIVAVVLVFGLVMLVWETRRPGRHFPLVAGWLPRAFALTAIQALIAWLATVTWDRWTPHLAVWHLGGRGLVPDALLGYVVITFVFYWWHRARHKIPFLWRWFHQVHHSACRIEVLTSFYKHPVEILVNSVLTSSIVYVLLGLDPVSASLTVALTGLGELFYHWNVKTPYWLGYVFQRPESHCVHHQRGHHTNNFSDFPVWDLLFGTFENPRVGPAECGFDPDIERQLAALLIGWSPKSSYKQYQQERSST